MLVLNREDIDIHLIEKVKENLCRNVPADETVDGTIDVKINLEEDEVEEDKEEGLEVVVFLAESIEDSEEVEVLVKD